MAETSSEHVHDYINENLQEDSKNAASLSISVTVEGCIHSHALVHYGTDVSCALGDDEGGLVARPVVDWERSAGVHPELLSGGTKARLRVLWWPDRNHNAFDEAQIRWVDPSLHIPSEVLAQARGNAETFRFHVVVRLVHPMHWNDVFAIGRAHLKIIVNAGPRSGRCSLLQPVPNPVIAQDTTLSVQCDDWIDPIHTGSANTLVFGIVAVSTTKDIVDQKAPPSTSMVVNEFQNRAHQTFSLPYGGWHVAVIVKSQESGLQTTTWLTQERYITSSLSLDSSPKDDLKLQFLSALIGKDTGGFAFIAGILLSLEAQNEHLALAEREVIAILDSLIERVNHNEQSSVVGQRFNDKQLLLGVVEATAKYDKAMIKEKAATLLVDVLQKYGHSSSLDPPLLGQIIPVADFSQVESLLSTIVELNEHVQGTTANKCSSLDWAQQRIRQVLHKSGIITLHNHFKADLCGTKTFSLWKFSAT